MLTVWEAKAFETEHERAEVVEVVTCLHNFLGKRGTPFHLLLSPRIKGCSFDALLMGPFGFCIFEFKSISPKDYVVATENSWTRGASEHRREKMKGGSEHDAGPYEQVVRYRHKLSEFLRDDTRGYLNLATPVKEYKSRIKGGVIIFPKKEKGVNDEITIDERWFSVFRIDKLQVFVEKLLSQARQDFVDDELQDVIRNCIGFLSETGCSSEEYLMKSDLNEERLRQLEQRNREKQQAKANKRIQKGMRKDDSGINLTAQTKAVLDAPFEKRKAESSQKDVVESKMQTVQEQVKNSLDLVLYPERYPEALALLKEKVFVGIDFGTSNTTVTVLRYDEEKKRLLAEPLKIRQSDFEDDVDACESHIVPTAIAYDKKFGCLVYGKGVLERLRNKPNMYRVEKNCWTEFKMKVGVREQLYSTSQLSKVLTPLPGVVIENAEDATRVFFSYLKKQIDAYAKKEGKVAEYAITVPASFALSQREGLRNALKEAGINLKPYALLDEPNGAFVGTLAYYLVEGRKAAVEAYLRNKYTLVFDFGAGTCDISVLALEDKNRLFIKNCAISNFTALGGRNIDWKIVEDVLLSQLNEQNSNVYDSLYDDEKRGVNAILAHTAEKLKCAICAQANMKKVVKETRISFKYRKEKEGLTIEVPMLSRDEFVKIMDSFCDENKQKDSIFVPIFEALKKAGLNKRDVDAIILVGGSAKNPKIKETLAHVFGSDEKVIEPGDICSLVSRGAAVASFYANGMGVPIITPILSEGIFIVTDVNDRVELVSSGTPVPLGKRVFEKRLCINDFGDGVFTIPFYAGTKTRPLGEARFELDLRKIAIGDEVSLSYELDEEKTLRYWIRVNDLDPIRGKLAYPIQEGEVTETEQIVGQVKVDLDQATLANKGKPPKEALKKSAKALSENGRYEKAADCLRDIVRFYPNDVDIADVELLMAENYSKAKLSRLEYEAYCRSHDLKPTHMTYWYKIWAAERAFGWQSEEVAQALEDALRQYSSDNDFLYIKVCHLEETGQVAKAKALARNIYEDWCRVPLSSLQKPTLDRFWDLAHRVLEEYEMAGRINNYRYSLSQQQTQGNAKTVRAVYLHLDDRYNA